MASPATQSVARRTSPITWWAVTGLVTVAAAALRSAINFGATIPTGMDAAYYPTQTRWLMEHGRLMYDDLPLYFRLLAGITRLIMVLTGRPIDEAALLASRAADSITGAIITLPIMLIAFRVSRGSQRGAVAGVCAAALAALSIAPVRMTSDFQKNTLGLLWLAAAVCALHVVLSAPGRIRAWLLVALFTTLAALTHLGAAAATLLVLSLCLATSLLTGRRLSLRAMARVGAAGVLLGGLGFSALYAADPSRAQKLLAAPAKLIQLPGASPMPGPGGRDGPGLQRSATPEFSGRRDGPMARGPGRGPGGGPPGSGDSLITILSYGGSLIALGLLAVRRRQRPAADRALVIGCAAGAMLLACPLVSPEYAQRLGLMSAVPAALSLAAALATASVAGSRRLWAPLGGMVFLGSLASAAQGFQRPHPPVVSVESLAELRALRTMIDDPATTLIVARHGLEWWAGYTLNTPVRLGRIPNDAFQRYRRVLIVQDARPMRGPGGGMPPGGPGGFGPPGRGMGPPGGPGMMMVHIPEDAELIFDGDHYRVYEVFGVDHPSEP